MLCTALCYQGIMVICPVSGVNAGENGLRKSVCATFTWTLWPSQYLWGNITTAERVTDILTLFS